MPEDSSNKTQAQAEARQKLMTLRLATRIVLSPTQFFATMRTALNPLAGHSSYPNRPVPEKLKQRLEQEFKQVEVAVKRGA